MNNHLISGQNIKKSFYDANLSVNVLKGIEINIEKNQSISIVSY